MRQPGDQGLDVEHACLCVSVCVCVCLSACLAAKVKPAGSWGVCVGGESPGREGRGGEGGRGRGRGS